MTILIIYKINWAGKDIINTAKAQLFTVESRSEHQLGGGTGEWDSEMFYILVSWMMAAWVYACVKFIELYS